jgi:type VI secretion system ImpB/VipA family protein
VFKLEFSAMADFKPVAVAQKVAEKVEPFSKLLELRRQIKKLVNAMDGNEAVQDLIQKMINDRGALNQLCQEAGRGDSLPQEVGP